MLLSRLRPGTVCWGHRLSGYSEDLDGITAAFVVSDSGTAAAAEPKKSEDDTNAYVHFVRCDVLVGADGLNSIVRQLRDAEEFQLLQHGSAITGSGGAGTGRVGVNGSETSPGAGPWLSSSISSSGYSAISTNAIRLSTPTPLEYLGVAVIIGLSSFVHPLITRQGFYVLDGTHRLFTMPFKEGSATEEPQHMWQLSFSGVTLHEASLLRSMPATALLAQAAKRTAGWMAPVPDLLASTAAHLVWGTPLFDRAPMALHGAPKPKPKPKPNAELEPEPEFPAGKNIPQTEAGAEAAVYVSAAAYGRAATGGKAALGSRVTLLGDAAHPMSMFKGQGCNQALEDGPLLANWLLGGKQKRRAKATAAAAAAEKEAQLPPQLFREVLLRRLRSYEREMVDRTSVKQAASREAARMLHSAAVLGGAEAAPGDERRGGGGVTLFGFEGVMDEYKHRHASEAGSQGGVRASASASATASLQALRASLRDSGVTAACAGELDHRVRACIEQLRQTRTDTAPAVERRGA